MKNKIFKLIINIALVAFWFNGGYELLLEGQLWEAFLVLVKYFPPIWVTWYLCLKKQLKYKKSQKALL